MAWGKKVKLIIGDGSSENSTGDAIDLSPLDFQFRVLRSNTYEKNKAEFTIWNPSEATQAAFMRADFSDVNFWAGYEDSEYGLIFAGHVLSVIPEWSGADLKTTLVCSPLRANGYTEDENKKIKAENPYKQELENTLYKLKVELQNTQSEKSTKATKQAKQTKIINLKSRIDIVEKAIKDTNTQAVNQITATQVVNYTLGREFERVKANTYMSISIAPKQKLAELIRAVEVSVGIRAIIPNEMDFVLENGYNKSASLKTILRDIKEILWSKQWKMYIDLKEWVIYDSLNPKQTLDVAYFDETSGLLTISPARVFEYEKDRPQILPPANTWEVRTILHPAVAPNAIIHVNSLNLSGLVKLDRKVLVEQVEFVGDNAQGEYICNILVSQQESIFTQATP